MKKSSNMALSCALATLGIASMVYSYVQMHPRKIERLAEDMKDMMKDF